MDHLYLHKKIQHEGKTGYACPHVTPEEKNGRSNKNEEDNDDEKLKMEETLHWCYSTNPAWTTSVNKMKKQNVQITNNI